MFNRGLTTVVKSILIKFKLNAYLTGIYHEFVIKVITPKIPIKITAQISICNTNLWGLCFAMYMIPLDNIKSSKI